MALIKLACVVLLLFMVMGVPIAKAGITCGQVTSSLSSCIAYLMGGGAVPPACCNGVKSLNAAANTTPDRQAACRCLKSAAASISGNIYGRAAGLPRKCGVNVPYPISPGTDCNKVK